MTLLTVDIAKKMYGNGCCAIENLSFIAQPGEFVALVGPSGAGKTSLLNLIAGLDREMAGKITFHSGQAEQVDPRIGYLFQEPRLMPWLTVLQNLELVLTAQSLQNQARSVQDWLALVGLEGWGDLFPGQLSGGCSAGLRCCALSSSARNSCSWTSRFNPWMRPPPINSEDCC
jgi:ABC-type nitrate/sulfonate/bicarbonate transport system ATPase subunit